MKVTAKLVITMIIVSLLSMFTFEFMYNGMLYSDYKDLYNKTNELERKYDLLTMIVIDEERRTNND